MYTRDLQLRRASGRLQRVATRRSSRRRRAGRSPRARPARAPRRASRRSSAAVSASPVAVPPSAVSGVDGGAHLVVVAASARPPLDAGRVALEADEQVARACWSRNVRAAACAAAEPAWADVVGRHRARRVGDEHDRRLLDRHGDDGLRAGERHRERDRRGERAAPAEARRRHAPGRAGGTRASRRPGGGRRSARGAVGPGAQHAAASGTSSEREQAEREVARLTAAASARPRSRSQSPAR